MMMSAVNLWKCGFARHCAVSRVYAISRVSQGMYSCRTLTQLLACGFFCGNCGNLPPLRSKPILRGNFRILVACPPVFCAAGSLAKLRMLLLGLEFHPVVEASAAVNGCGSRK